MLFTKVSNKLVKTSKPDAPENPGASGTMQTGKSFESAELLHLPENCLAALQRLPYKNRRVLPRDQIAVKSQPPRSQPG